MITQPYPLHCLQEIGFDFASGIARALRTKDALVGPVVLSAMAAAVHGTLDIYSPMHSVMPTSLFTTVVAGSGLGKSMCMNYAYQGFRDFEAGFEGSFSSKEGFDVFNGHPYRIDDASESGLIALFGAGAKAIAMALDEGGMLADKLDLQRMCKHFDGDDLRFIRKHEFIQVRGTRTNFCMTVQDAVFDSLLKGKQGPLLVPSGFMPRMLMSYATNTPSHISFIKSPDKNLNLHPFHDRVRALMEDYRMTLISDSPRKQIQLSSDAERVWGEANDYWKSLPSSDDAWVGMEPFVYRAGENALRIAAVLQWFTDPRLEINEHCMRSALALMEWHLEQALMGFGAPAENALQIRLGNELYAYLLRKCRVNGQGAFMRVDLLRKGPANLRKAADLDLAIDQLFLENKLVPAVPGTRKQLILNMTPNFVPGMASNAGVPTRTMADLLTTLKPSVH